MSDSYRQVAIEAINALQSEEAITEQAFGIGAADENFYEGSQELHRRLKSLDRMFESLKR